MQTTDQLADEILLTPGLAAGLLHVSRPVIMYLIRHGELAATDCGGGRYLIPESEIADFADRRAGASRHLAEAFARGRDSERELINRASGLTDERIAELGVPV